MASAEVRCDIWGHAESAETPLGLLITQRSQVQILPPLLFTQVRGLFRFRRRPSCCGLCTDL